MEAEQLHLPDFTVPDFAQPALHQADLARPGLMLPDPARPEQVVVMQPSLWPDDLAMPDANRPDPASPDLLKLERPADLSWPDPGLHALQSPEVAPQVVMQQRPGEMDPSAREMLLDSPDVEDLPPHLSYPPLYMDDDGMSTRKRHLGMLELGLERAEGDKQ